MEEEIIRKVIPRKSCLISRSQQNGNLRSHLQSAVNLHRPLFLKRTLVKPCMTSTPQHCRRKMTDNSEYEFLTKRRRKGKACRYSNDLLDNVTPIKSQEGKHSLGLVQGITSVNVRANKDASAHRNICGESFDIMADKSPTQNQMLSLDESILETVDLDSAVKDYWDSQNRNLNFDIQGMECENLQSCPEGSDKAINDEIMKFTRQPGAASSCSVRTQCLKNLCDMHSPTNRMLYEHTVPSDSPVKDSGVRIKSDLNADFQSTDVVWENDSLFEDALSSIETEGIVIPNSPVVSNMPLGEKIKRTLITNVEKPITPKAKSMQVNDEHVPQNSSLNTCEESTHNFVGPFFGLPVNVKSLIHKFKGITDLYVWQMECLNLVALQQRKNLVYALPTSGGKTLVAEIMILRELVCRRKNAIFILPYVAIVQEKVRSLAPFGLELDFFVEEYAAGKGQYPPPKRRRKQTVYVATIEKALGLTNSLIEAQRLEELGLFVVDELHLVGDSSGRGSILEGLLTKVMYMQGLSRGDQYLYSDFWVYSARDFMRVHKNVQDYLQHCLWKVQRDPLYSPDFSPCDYDMIPPAEPGTAWEQFATELTF